MRPWTVNFVRVSSAGHGDLVFLPRNCSRVALCSDGVVTPEVIHACSSSSLGCLCFA